MRFENLMLLDDQNLPVVGAHIAIFNPDWIAQDIVSDETGTVEMAMTPIDPEGLWIAAVGHHAVTAKPGIHSELRMDRLSNGGSVIIDNIGYIAGLGTHLDEDGRLNPILDAQGRMYMYANNVSFDGRVGIAHPFNID